MSVVVMILFAVAGSTMAYSALIGVTAALIACGGDMLEPLPLFGGILWPIGLPCAVAARITTRLITPVTVTAGSPCHEEMRELPRATALERDRS